MSSRKTPIDPLDVRALDALGARERRATPTQGVAGGAGGAAALSPLDVALARRHAKHLALLRSVSTHLTHTAAPAEVAQLVLDALAEAFDARWVALFRARPDGSFVRRAVRPVHGADDAAAATPPGINGPAVTRLHYAPDAPLLAGPPSTTDPDPARLLGAEMAVPLDDQRSRLGWLAVGPRRENGADIAAAATQGAALGGAPPYDETDLRFLALVAHFAAPRFAYADLAAAYRHAALIDAATGLGNRRAFEERIEEELAHSNRTGQPVALVLCEIDDGAALAARLGPAAHDRTLRAVAEVVNQSVRRSDTVFRHGDTRIAVILTNADTSGARIAAERARAGVAALTPPDVAEPLTCSVGIAALKQGVHKPLSLATLALFNKADEAVYRAAREGGNRCVVR